MDDILSKPVDFKQLSNVLAKYLSLTHDGDGHHDAEDEHHM
jgi:hypothetical protein